MSEREKFEAWARRRKYPTGRAGDEYNSPATEIAWEAWQARAALSPDWRGMESAPKDGTRVLIASGSAVISICRFAGGQWLTVPGGWARYPTDWMPLPSPSALQPNEKGEST